ncbi:hypothetical protein CDAR_562641 [Caerostris darwini]|uniref:Uncharacterized protein n=1 Tax=Caerostris darwini TaxID=1538125 RepID=A0AAV4X6S2_9ARAC|nr:hypothetical protein CDAR_562641 [Caerostris darwini]
MSCHSVEVAGGGVPVVVVEVEVEEELVETFSVVVVFSVDDNLVVVDEGSSVVKPVAKDTDINNVATAVTTNDFGCCIGFVDHVVAEIETWQSSGSLQMRVISLPGRMRRGCFLLWIWLRRDAEEHYVRDGSRERMDLWIQSALWRREMDGSEVDLQACASS